LTNEFSLKCKTKITYSENTGYKKNDIEEIIVEVIDSIKPKFKSFIIKSLNESVNNIAVTVPPPPKLTGDNYEIKSFDFSDDNKYEVTSNSLSTNKNVNINTMIYISRNTGEIIVSHEFINKKGSAVTSIGGNCEKIDRTKKKF
jgi:hypothetical protein